MNKKRKITVKDPHLRKIRYELRSLLRLVWLDRLDELDNKHRKADSVEEMQQISWKIQDLKRAFYRHPIGCTLCGDRDVDLIYNPNDSSWYCEPCYTFQQEEYRKMGNYHLYP
ncbi:MAG: hypothetical protein GF311_22650 [Candidatus Lokiarchaeota archaeon]|nr:hypothetical protein [Candidatus Lokiarchaeota archaeon]